MDDELTEVNARADVTARLLSALELVDQRPGRQIRRDLRGWKDSEVQLDRLVVGFVSPSFGRPLAFAMALIDSEWRSAALLDDRMIGPAALES